MPCAGRRGQDTECGTSSVCSWHTPAARLRADKQTPPLAAVARNAVSTSTRGGAREDTSGKRVCEHQCPGSPVARRQLLATVLAALMPRRAGEEAADSSRKVRIVGGADGGEEKVVVKLE